jgi:hypothetical protein
MISALLLNLGQAPQESRLPSGRLLWDVTLGEDGSFYRLESACASDYEEILIGAIADPPAANPSVANELWLWRLDANGSVLCTTNVQPPNEVRQARLKGDPFLAEYFLVGLTSDGGGLCVAGYGEGRPWLMRMDSGGNLLSTRELVGPTRSAAFTGLVALRPDGYLLVGFEFTVSPSGNALALRIDSSGSIVEEFSIREPQLTRYVDGTALGEDLFAVGMADGHAGSPLCWLVRLGDPARVPLARPFLSQHLQVEAFNGRLLLLQNGDSGPNAGTWLHAITPTLNTTWTQPILQGAVSIQTPDLHAAKEILVVSDARDHLCATAFDDLGQQRATFTEETPRVAGERAITALPNGDLIVASTIYPSTPLGYRGRVRATCVRMLGEQEEPRRK